MPAYIDDLWLAGYGELSEEPLVERTGDFRFDGYGTGGYAHPAQFEKSLVVRNDPERLERIEQHTIRVQQVLKAGVE